MRPSLQSSVDFRFAGLDWQALASGALYLGAEKLLIVSDLHLGKSLTFARHGQLLPPFEVDSSLDLLAADIRSTNATRVACLGDSFHDSASIDGLSPRHLNRLQALAENCDWTWVTGNHDGNVLRSSKCLPIEGQVVGCLEVQGVVLEHQPPADIEAAEDPVFRLFGHFHPKARIRVSGNLKTSGKCFLVGEKRLCMPAFGVFAGGLNVRAPALKQAVGPLQAALLCRPPNVFQVDPNHILQD